MIAAKLTSDGRCKRYATWEDALCYCMSQSGVRATNPYNPGTYASDGMPTLSGLTGADRAHEFARLEPEGSLRSLLELAEGAADVGDYEAVALYAGFTSQLNAWLAAPAVDPFAPPSDVVTTRDPERVVRKRKQKSTPIRVFTPEQVAALIAEAPTNTAEGLRFRAMTALMYATGLRISECCQLRADAIRGNGSGVSIVSVPCEDGCKTGARDVVFPSAKVEPYLSEYVKVRDESEYLFSTWNGTHVHRNAYNRALKEYGARAGITGTLHAHMWRHTYATEYLRSGGRIDVLQAQLGHKDPTMSLKYAAAIKTDEIAAMMQAEIDDQ